MSNEVYVALIITVLGGIITGVFQIINKKADRAKEEVNQNTAEVEAVNKALEGMTYLMAQLRSELDRRDIRITTLEEDVAAEKSINVALALALKKEQTRGHQPGPGRTGRGNPKDERS